ncbi:741_t:CDS:2 [Funneliformis caledonium]|uniref:741_t:CDS:1 n=1 Tax=Funneliformis caledonium TaxID=1117310 RepID=A0A9N9F6W6_9GLOM|nr:741_t:CDS:2 [Funneliformis caledonium]
MEKSNLQNNIPQNPFYKFSLKQRKESEEFGRLTIEYIKRQNENLQQLYSESEIVESRIKDYCRCKETIREQEHLIGTLKYRIEQLEASIVIKNQDINNCLNIIRKSKEEMKLKENRESPAACSELSRKHHRTAKKSSISLNDNENKQTKQVQDPPIYTISIGDIIKKYANKVQESQGQKQGNNTLSESLLDNPSSRERLKRDEKAEDQETISKLKQIHNQLQQVITQSKGDPLFVFKEQEDLIDSLKSRILRLEESIVVRNQEIDDFIKTINEEIKRFTGTIYKLEKNREDTNNVDYKCIVTGSDLKDLNAAKENYSKGSFYHRPTETASISKDQDPPTFTITMNDIIKRYFAKVKESKQKKNIVHESSEVVPTSSVDTSLKSSFAVTQSEGVIENLKSLKKGEKVEYANDAKDEITHVPSNTTKSSNIEQIHTQIKQIITQKEAIGNKIRLKHIQSLEDSFTRDELIQYSKTNYYHSLNDNIKRLFKQLLTQVLASATHDSTKSSKFEQIHTRIQNIITQKEVIDSKIKLKHIRPFKDSFTRDELIRYTKTTNFNSLNDRTKRLFVLFIQELSSTSTNEIDAIKLENLHKKIITIAETRGKTISKDHLDFLKNPSVFNYLIHYKKTHHFDSLSDLIKSFIDSIIYDGLKKEFNREKITLSQNLEEYIKRGLIPQLPTGYHNYAEYERTGMFFCLSRKQKSRVRKLVVLENKMGKVI